MSDGRKYQEAVLSEANKKYPSTITEENVKNAFRIRARGMTWNQIRPWIGRELVHLIAIPLDADLLDASAYDEEAIAALREIHRTPGVKVANATKLLHQKRPSLIPILDKFVRRALYIYYVHPTKDWSAFHLGFQQFRKFCQLGPNAEALQRLVDYIRSDPDVTCGLDVSRVRLVDILAWGVVRGLAAPALGD